MSSIIQATAVESIFAALSVGTFVLEHLGIKRVMDLHTSSANVSPMNDSPTAFYVRRDRKNKQKLIRIFSAAGIQLYTIERLSAFNPVWNLYTFPSRREVATIEAGLFSSSVDFHNKVGVSHRDINVELGLNGRFRSFYLNDGAKYSWSGGSKFLERIINPHGGVEETRERIAKVKLMRQFKFDFEVLVDETKIDREFALATAFVSMLTQWGVGESTNTVGPTFIAPLIVNEVSLEPEQIDNAKKGSEESTEGKIVLVIQNNEDSKIEIEQS